jgi:hypothetical protein
MTVTFTLATRQSQLSNYASLFGTAAMLALFSGVAPTNADTALSGNAILGALPMAATPFGSPNSATPSVMAAATLTQENAYSSGTATFYRAYTPGSSAAATTMVAGNVYQINAPGNTVWTNYGAPNDTAGTVFVANGAGSGTGTCFPMTAVEQGSVGTSGQDLNLNTTTIVAGGPIACTAFTVSM